MLLNSIYVTSNVVYHDQLVNMLINLTIKLLKKSLNIMLLIHPINIGQIHVIGYKESSAKPNIYK